MIVEVDPSVSGEGVWPRSTEVVVVGMAWTWAKTVVVAESVWSPMLVEADRVPGYVVAYGCPVEVDSVVTSDYYY